MNCVSLLKLGLRLFVSLQFIDKLVSVPLKRVLPAGKVFLQVLKVCNLDERHFSKNRNELMDEGFELIQENVFGMLLCFGVDFLKAVFIQVIELNVVGSNHGAVLFVEGISLFSRFTCGKVVNRIEILVVDAAFEVVFGGI